MMPRRKKTPDEITLPGLLAGVKAPKADSPTAATGGKILTARQLRRMQEASDVEAQRKREAAETNLIAALERRLMRLRTELPEELLQPLAETHWLPSTLRGIEPLKIDQPAVVDYRHGSLDTPGRWYPAAGQPRFYPHPEQDVRFAHPVTGEHRFGGITPALGWTLVTVTFYWPPSRATGGGLARPIALGVAVSKVKLASLLELDESMANRLSDWLGRIEAELAARNTWPRQLPLFSQDSEAAGATS